MAAAVSYVIIHRKNDLFSAILTQKDAELASKDTDLARLNSELARINTELVRINTELVKKEAELEEERRMFYVAMTRAKDKLHISYMMEKSGKRILPSRFVNEILSHP